MDALSKISNAVIKKPRKTKKKMLEDFKIISPTSPLRQQIREALKPEIELLSNQRPKIIIMEDSFKPKPKAEKPLKPKTKKATKKPASKSPKSKSPSSKSSEKKTKKAKTKKDQQNAFLTFNTDIIENYSNLP